MFVVVLNGLKVGSMTIDLGWVGVIALMLSYFFMSIMYPTIFALGIKGLGKRTKLASGFIVMSIVGGALAPFFMGWIADRSSMRIGFVVPLICFAVIMLYGFTWKSFFRRDMLPESDHGVLIEPIPAP
jgi:FHS family L-fucose permease-like MFS transporter